MNNSAYTTISIGRWNGRWDMKSAFGWETSPGSHVMCRYVPIRPSIPMSYVQTRWWLNMKNKLNKRENTCKHEVNYCNKRTDIIFMRAFSKVRVMKTEFSLLEAELEQPRGCACASSWLTKNAKYQEPNGLLKILICNKRALNASIATLI